MPAAKDLLNGVASNIEHPFFGKIWGAIGIYLFGNDFFGWRIFYVIIGVLSVYVMYLVALNFVSKPKALLAASFLGFETLFFIHTSLLLLEGPPILFALIGFLAYFKRSYYVSAFAMGLSVLSKEWSVYFIFALILYHLYTMPKQDIQECREEKCCQTGDRSCNHDPHLRAPHMGIRHYLQALCGWIRVSDKPLAELPSITSTINLYSPVAVRTTAWNCYPWNWILPFNIEPSGYYVVTTTVTTTLANGLQKVVTTHPIDWLGIGNFAVWYAIWPITGMIALQDIQKEIHKG